MSHDDGSARLVLRLPTGAQAFTLSKASVTLGRAATSDIILRSSQVSRQHARIDRTPAGYEIVDLGSVNGLSVNGRPASRAPLAPGDVVTIGDCRMEFESGPAQTAAADEGDAEAMTVAIQRPATVHLADSHVPRVAVHTPAGTWEVSMPGDVLTIGRDANNDVVIDHPSVSRHHAVVERDAAGLVVRDLNSRNGVWAGEDRVVILRVRDGATVKVGVAQIAFKDAISADAFGNLDAPSDAARRPVVIIPGFAGSMLWRGSERIWPTFHVRSLAESLRIDRPLEARGLVDEVVVVPGVIHLDQYGLLSGYLTETLGYEEGRDLLEFAYDFRQDNRESARRLGAAIEAWDVDRPITIIAHSMACLIARYYVERLGGHRRVERVILLGGPHAGAPYGLASLVTGPDLLPLGLLNHQLRDIIATFPSWYQILPAYQCVSDPSGFVDVLGDETWLAEPHRPLLRNARQFRRELGMRASVPTVCVFGYGVRTIASVTMARGPDGRLVSAEMAEEQAGDGMIPERSGVLRGAEIHPVKQHHGSLYVDTDVKMRLRLELTRGQVLA
jgi:pSer/pThr/pTyr-binding forkhead associated (FHA) protein